MHSNTIRLFVSSTFADMQQERDILHQMVFPSIEKLCEEKGLVFSAIDLRWGVTEHQSEQGDNQLRFEFHR